MNVHSARLAIMGAAVLFALTDAAQGPPRSLSVPDGFTFAAVGDLLQERPLMPLEEAQFREVDSIIRGADVAFGNGEMPIIDISSSRVYPEAENGGGDLYGLPSVAADLKAQGFAIVSRANNHSTDWGISGMEMTDRFLDDAGIVHAGTGRNEAAARAAHFIETKWGRVGLASTTSTFEGNEPAGAAFGDVAGRPGASTLSTTQAIVVSQSTINGLRQYYGGAEYSQDASLIPHGILLYTQPYVAGNAPGIQYTMDPHDLGAILRGIRQGSTVSNFMVFSVHCHESASGASNVVPQGAFLRDLAHKAIDAGADVFVGHGPHQVGGIEIYKGKPIFYSLGNYIFQLDLLENPNAESWRGSGLDSSRSIDADYEKTFIKHWFTPPEYWQSVIAVTTYRNNAAAEISLYPLDLRQTAELNMRGIPRLADDAEAATILKRIARLSEPYHTHIQIEGRVGKIVLQ